MSTRAIEFLKKKDLTFEVVKYDHKEKGAAFASESIDFPLEFNCRVFSIRIKTQ